MAAPLRFTFACLLASMLSTLAAPSRADELAIDTGAHAGRSLPVRFEGSLGVLALPSTTARFGPLFEAGVYYSTPRWYAGGSLDLTTQWSGDDTAKRFASALRARYLLTDTAIAPFVGTGLVLASLQAERTEFDSGKASHRQTDQLLPAALLEIGLEAFHDKPVRALLSLRADFSLTTTAATITAADCSSGPGPGCATRQGSRYEVPLMASLGVTF